MKENITITIFFITVITMFGWFINTAVDDGEQRRMTANTENQEKYQECKERTTDVEWCFNEFRPNL